ncbi:NAD(P)-binding protein [Lentithecium fluviatile CBS 122367]|uniref:NAD(P)-binding protein n=1 Tax=Lentithecium fluviatile CBS 122367 TaxID=1168545 RepID=A0A6G1IR67_9PLEO|nr:NAD(P)-binding protein [Lentithecium fluviatile CBS 122367]
MSIPHMTKTVHHAVYPAINPANPKLSAAGKTVIISGGAGGIGFSIAQGFSIAGAARVVILARRQEALDEAAGKLNTENAASGRKTEIWTYLLDIRDSAAAEDVFNSIRGRLNEGRKDDGEAIDADILVTSAASLEQGKLAIEFDAASYRDNFETNVVGNVNLVRAFLAPEIPGIPFTTFNGDKKDISSASKPKHKKTILDVSSSASYLVFPGQGIYGSSKLAFTRVMRALQSEVDLVDGQPIRIYSFNPGTVYTPGVAKLIDEEGLKVVPFEFDEESLPMGFAVWLASPEAEFLKGRFVMSNWDVDELVALKDKYAADPTFGTITLRQ